MSSFSNSPAPLHRKEIDGLRSIAVLAVVFYHFGLTGFGGGFVGVDIFFVLSGFLIGGILWREHAATGRLSLARFYLRRIRRLAPAYFAMAIASLIVASFILLPYEFREFGKGLIAATVYLSNVLFYRQAGYFDSASEDKIFLHTWSLSVEEQFYLFLPVVFLLLARSRRGMIWGLILLTLASLIGCIWLTPQNQTASFYLFPFRAWELLAGVLLAIWGIERRTNWAFGWPWSWLGLGLTLAGIFMLTPGQGFPGWQATLPVIGTVLLIANGRHDNLVNQVLSMKAPVFIGLISYSLYLWHWPVLSLSTYLRQTYSGPFETTGWVALSGFLAVLSWRFIEQPVRVSAAITGRWLLAGTALASVMMLGAGAAIYQADGMINRFDQPARMHIAATADFLQDWSRCRVDTEGALRGIEVCPIGPEGQQPDLLIWGDSHVRAFYQGLALSAQENGRAALVIWRAGCAPLFDLDKVENSASHAQDIACRAANDQIRNALQHMPHLRDLLLIGRWNYYATGSGIGLDAQNSIRLTLAKQNDDQSSILGGDQGAILGRAVRQSMAWMNRRFDVVSVLRQVPEVAGYDARIFARQLAHGRMSQAEAEQRQSITRADLAARNLVSNAIWQNLSEAGQIRLLNPWPMFCNSQSCSAIVDQVGQYFDNNHITNAAAYRLRRLFDPVFD